MMYLYWAGVPYHLTVVFSLVASLLMKPVQFPHAEDTQTTTGVWGRIPHGSWASGRGTRDGQKLACCCNVRATRKAAWRELRRLYPGISA